MYLSKIIQQQRLSYHEAQDLIHLIASDELNELQLAGILTGIQLRGISLDEIKGFRNALKSYALRLDLSGEKAIDVCGTGGDGKDTFNISTASAFVLAAMGYKVIKHGNYGVSSSCGSSNVLEALGYQFSTDSKSLVEELNQSNICFIHAPLFHPVLKKVAPLRKALGVRTFFNALGPLLNPVQTEYQVTGTFSLELAKIYQFLLRDERTSFQVIYGMEGYDECTLNGDTRILGKSTDLVYNANSFKVSEVEAVDLKNGKTTTDAALILSRVLAGEGTIQQTNVVAVNVALGLQCYHPKNSIVDLFHEAKAFILSGKVASKFNFIRQQLEQVQF